MPRRLACSRRERGPSRGRSRRSSKCNSSNSWAGGANQAITGGVEDALRLGCSAIGFTIYPGSDDCFDMMEEIKELSAEAKSVGIATVIWSYPRGGNLPKSGELALDVGAYAAHMAALLGAHIIKVKLPSDHIEQKDAKKAYEGADWSKQSDRVAHVVKACFNGRRIVVFSGGAAKGEDAVYPGRARHSRRRRQRIDHRPQHIPARRARRAGDARQAGEHLQGRGVTPMVDRTRPIIEEWVAVDAYIAGHLIADDPQAALAANAAAGLPEIDVSAAQGKMLHLLARMAGARRILEIGTLGGYSTIWLARAVGEGGAVVTLELEPDYAAVARANLEAAGVGDRVEIRVGPAIESLAALDGPFDFVFIDADKARTSPI